MNSQLCYLEWDKCIGNSRIDYIYSLDSSSSIVGAMIGSIDSINSKGPYSEFAPKRFWRHAMKPPEFVAILNLNFIVVGVELVLALIRCHCHTELVVSSVSENGDRRLKDKAIIR